MNNFEDFWKDYQYKPHFSPKGVAEDVWKAFEEKYGALYSAQECRDDYWGIKRETWKAALEWFLEEYAYEFEGHMWHIIEEIEEELNES